MSPLRASPLAAGAGHIWRHGGAWHTFGYLAACEHPPGRASLRFPLPLHPLLPRPPPFLQAPERPGPRPCGMAGTARLCQRRRPLAWRTRQQGRQHSPSRGINDVHTKNCPAASCKPSSRALHRRLRRRGHRATPLQLPSKTKPHPLFILYFFPPSFASYESQIRCLVRLVQGLRGQPWTMAGTAW